MRPPDSDDEADKDDDDDWDTEPQPTPASVRFAASIVSLVLFLIGLPKAEAFSSRGSD